MNQGRNTVYSISDNEFKKIWNTSTTYREVLRRLKPTTTYSGSEYRALKARQKELNLSSEHMLGQGHSKGKKFHTTHKQSLSEILVEGSNYSIFNLKKRLFEANLLKNECAWCGNSGTWNGNELTLHLDHINGINNDNRIENLRILCPMCHALTDTFRGRNKKRITENKSVDSFKFNPSTHSVFIEINTVCENCTNPTINGMLLCEKCSYLIIDEYDNEIRTKNIERVKNFETRLKSVTNPKGRFTEMPTKNYCIDCGIEVGRGIKRCKSCHPLFTRRNIPEKENLIQTIKEEKANLTRVGERFGVSCNAVRKWCRGYELPHTSGALKEMFING